MIVRPVVEDPIGPWRQLSGQVVNRPRRISRRKFHRPPGRCGYAGMYPYDRLPDALMRQRQTGSILPTASGRSRIVQVWHDSPSRVVRGSPDPAHASCADLRIRSGYVRSHGPKCGGPQFLFSHSPDFNNAFQHRSRIQEAITRDSKGIAEDKFELFEVDCRYAMSNNAQWRRSSIDLCDPCASA